MKLNYPFQAADVQAAHAAWGCNCGPAALAFILQISLDEVRPLIPEFEQKRYTSPTMMKSALAAVGRTFVNFAHDPLTMYHEQPSLVRIQWCGPWTAPGANPRWAYRFTHWIVSWMDAAIGYPLVFDVNSGITTREPWETITAPSVMEQIPRADGKWFPTHVWRLDPS